MIEPMIEREIKFRLPEGKNPQALRQVVESAGFRFEPAGTIAQDDRYLDTEDWALYRGGLALRLRSDGHGLRLQAKTVGSEADSLLTRVEWVQGAPAGDPPWGTLDPGPVTALLQSLRGMRIPERLAVRARVINDRECFRWLRGDTLLGSLTVDHVSVPPATFREVELELLNGADEALVEVRRVIEERLGLSSGVETKLAAALTAKGERLPERDERAFAIGPADRLLDVAHKIFGRQLTRTLWNEPGTRMGVDPECLHDMRVAIRRLRTALQVLSEGFPPAVREELEGDARWIGRSLGQIRDLDVGLERVQELESEAALFEQPALRIFREYLSQRRARRRLRLIERLDSGRYASFVIKARGWVEGGPPAAVLATEGVVPAYSAAPRIIGRWMQSMREAFDTAHRSMEPTDLHELRIAAKKARYAIEYFAELEGPSAIQRAKRIAGLQDFLGEHQDTLFLLRRMRRYARKVPRSDRELTLGAGSILGHFERAARIKRGKLREEWEKATAE
jgi:triphosphatase